MNFVGSGRVKIYNSNFIRNQGQASTIFALSAQAQLTVRNSSFISNQATNGGGVIGFSGKGKFLF